MLLKEVIHLLCLGIVVQTILFCEDCCASEYESSLD